MISHASVRKRVRRGIATLLLLWSPTAVWAAEDSSEAIIELLSERFFEVEFFVFERPAVMDFNTREILLHKAPVSYPSRLTSYPYPDQQIGEGYQLDAQTLLCMAYPTLTYTSTPVDDEQLRQTDLEQQDSAFDDVAPQPPATDSEEAQEAAGGPTEIPLIEPEVAIDPLAELRSAVIEFEQQLIDGSNQWLPDDALQLSREAGQVERRAGGRILFHGRWLQSVPGRDAPLAVLLPETPVTGADAELRGSVDVTLGRFLHFRARLNYAAPALGATPYQIAMDPQGVAMPVVEPVETANGFMTLNQSRRMRSEELHYLDHPKLGIVVRIDPVKVPESLLSLYERLTEDPE